MQKSNVAIVWGRALLVVSTTMIAATLVACSLLTAPTAALAAEGEQPGDQVRLTLAHYEKLRAAAQHAAVGNASWGRAQVSVALPDADALHASVRVSATIATQGEGPGYLLLLPGDQVLSNVTLDGSPATLVQRAGAHYAVIAKDSRPSGVVVEYLVPVRATADGTRNLLVPLPPVPGAALSVNGDGSGSAQVWPATAIQRGGGLQAALPAAAAFVLRWGDPSARGSVRKVAYQVSPDSGGDGVTVVATMAVDVGREGLDVQLCATSSALIEATDGKSPLTARVDDEWYVARLRGAGTHTLVVRFRAAIDRSGGQPQVELPLSGVPITEVTAVLAGKRSVTFEPEVPLVLTVSGQGDRATTRAVGHLPPSERVKISWTETRAAPENMVRFNTSTWQLVTLDEGVLRSRVIVEYEVIRGKLASLPLEVPDDVVVYKVEGGPVEDWHTFAASDGKPRQVKVSLAGSATGKQTLEMQLERTAPRNEGDAIAIPVVRPLGAFRELGAVALFDGEKVGFAKADATGFVTAGQDALPVNVRKTLKDKVNQAFKHVGPPGRLNSKVIPARKKDVRFDARAKTLYTIEERTIAGATSLVVEIKSGRVDHIVLSLPEGVAEPRINAPSLNKAEPLKDFDAGEGRKAWDVRFTQALEGTLQIHVEFEFVLPKELGRVQVPGVRVHGAEVEEGTLGVSAESSIEVSPEPGKELRRVDLDELPRALRRQSERELLFGFRYAQAPWQLAVDIKRHKTVETVGAEVIGAWIETNVLGNGHIVNRARYLVKNGEQQFLRIALAEGTNVLSVAVDGHSVKARRDDKGAIAISLPSAKTLVVELRYEAVVDKLGLIGSIDVKAPKLDIRQSALHWVLRAPGDQTVFNIDTELEKVSPSDWGTPPEVEGEAGLQVSVPTPRNAVAWHFGYQVLAPTEDAPGIAFMHRATGGEGLDLLLFLAALIGLLVFAWRRGKGRLRKVDWILLVAALLALLLKAVGWGIGFGEGLFAIVVVGVVAWVAARPAKKAVVKDDGFGEEQ